MIIPTRVFVKWGELSRQWITRNGVEVKKKKENSPSCAHVFNKTWRSFGHSTLFFGADARERYQNVKRTCWAIVFVHQVPSASTDETNCCLSLFSCRWQKVIDDKTSRLWIKLSTTNGEKWSRHQQSSSLVFQLLMMNAVVLLVTTMSVV